MLNDNKFKSHLPESIGNLKNVAKLYAYGCFAIFFKRQKLTFHSRQQNSNASNAFINGNLPSKPPGTAATQNPEFFMWGLSALSYLNDNKLGGAISSKFLDAGLQTASTIEYLYYQPKIHVENNYLEGPPYELTHRTETSFSSFNYITANIGAKNNCLLWPMVDFNLLTTSQNKTDLECTQFRNGEIPTTATATTTGSSLPSTSTPQITSLPSSNTPGNPNNNPNNVQALSQIASRTIVTTRRIGNGQVEVTILATGDPGDGGNSGTSGTNSADRKGASSTGAIVVLAGIAIGVLVAMISIAFFVGLVYGRKMRETLKRNAALAAASELAPNEDPAPVAAERTPLPSSGHQAMEDDRYRPTDLIVTSAIYPVQMEIPGGGSQGRYYDQEKDIYEDEDVDDDMKDKGDWRGGRADEDVGWETRKR
ncbi:hypothetical protein HDU97_006657 [Phlyctochytrium planicorne]|nr:hypothetical protein HDU97_006657 [Phlyctochytrium planicorne]